MNLFFSGGPVLIMKVFSSWNPVGSAACGVPSPDYIQVGMLDSSPWVESLTMG